MSDNAIVNETTPCVDELEGTTYQCSVCGYTVITVPYNHRKNPTRYPLPNYCSHCGARIQYDL